MDIYLFDVIIEFVLIGWQDLSRIDTALFLVFIILLIISLYEYKLVPENSLGIWQITWFVLRFGNGT